MWAIIKDNKVIATCSGKPCAIDLETRHEFSIECDTVNLGDIYNGENFTTPALCRESLLLPIRIERDSLLLQSDKYMLLDYPTGSLTREEWTAKVIAYRQALRDFPNTCDINNPVYPTL